MFADQAPLQIKKSSHTKRFDAAEEVRAYYLNLLKNNLKIKQQFNSLAGQSPFWGDVHSGTGEPQVIAWYPWNDEWDADKGFYHDDEHYLIVQPINFGRAKEFGQDFAVVSEFRVMVDGRTFIDPKDPDEKSHFVSNKITIQFLGFRDLTLKPTPAIK